MISYSNKPSGRASAVLILAVAFLSALSFGQAGPTRVDPGVLKNLVEAKSQLQTAIDTWDAGLMAEARDRFLGCLLQDKSGTAYLPYYVALADYCLATFHMAAGNAAESDPRIAEGEAYLEKATKTAPDFAEALALFGYFLGIEIANHPDRAMTLGMQSFEYFDRAESVAGSNPRVHLLRGIYQLYVPEAFGGGPDSSLGYLNTAIALFEKENVTDPLLPSWGKDEALTNAALAYKQKGDTAKAVELLKRALAVNPKSGRARGELAAIEK